MSKCYSTELIERRAQDKASGHTGIISVFTQVKLRGDPSKGPIPVRVEHRAIFTLDEPLLVQPDEVPLGGGFFQTEDEQAEVTQIIRAFPTSEECRAWVAHRFRVTSEDLNDLAGPGGW